MSRQIKFRVWDDQRKQFRDDVISFQIEENNIVEVSFENGENHFIKKDGFISYPSSQIQEFIGIQDRSGKDIYEGDILECKKTTSKFSYKFTCIVTVQYGCFGIITDRFIALKDLIEGNIKIIGNIYENPDLIN